jgi:hypothetical protein
VNALAAIVLALITPQQDDRSPKLPSVLAEGYVTDEITGEPISDASINFGRWPEGKSATTDSKGHYVRPALLPGNYSIRIVSRGYSTGNQSLTLAAGTDVILDFKLRKITTIFGRVLDAEGKPAVGVQVTPWIEPFHQTTGSSRYHLGSPTKTSADGRFVLEFYSLAAGRYYLVTQPTPLVEKGSMEGGRPEPVGNVMAVYPISLRRNEWRTGVEIVLGRSATFCARASLDYYPYVRDKTQTQLRLVSVYPAWEYDLVSQVVGDGELKFCGLAPGAYYLEVEKRRATSPSGGYNPRYGWISETWKAEATKRVDFKLSDRDLDLGKVIPENETKLHGRVTIAGATPGTPLPVMDVVWRSGFNFQRVRISASGDFEYSAFPEAPWPDFVLPHGYYVKQILVGDRDVTRTPHRGGASEVTVVLGSDKSSLVGRVVDKENRAVPKAVVALLASGSSRPETGTRPLILVADNEGRFEISCAEPGTYRLLAFDRGLYLTADDPDFLRLHLIEAVEMNLTASAESTVTIIAETDIRKQ